VVNSSGVRYPTCPKGNYVFVCHKCGKHICPIEEGAYNQHPWPLPECVKNCEIKPRIINYDDKGDRCPYCNALLNEYG
jgi:hypothetical protein